MVRINAQRGDPASVAFRIGIAERHEFRMNSENKPDEVAIRESKKERLWIEVLVQQDSRLKSFFGDGVEWKSNCPKGEELIPHAV
jgi:hypothetical protein